MNLYEELGVSAGASPEEIRKAFRQVTLLLHPDRQQDPEIKKVAEAQMKRLNLAMGQLMDPDLRQRYDESTGLAPCGIRRESGEGGALYGGPRAPVPAAAPLTWLPAWLCGASAGLALSLAAFWMFRVLSPAAAIGIGATANADGYERPAAPRPTGRGLVGNISGAPARAALRSRLDVDLPNAARVATRPRLAATPGVGTGHSHELLARPLRSAERLEFPLASSHESEIAFLPPAPAPIAARSVERFEAIPSPLSGHWIFLPAPNKKSSPGFYGAEYIEMRIVERAGQLQGLYRSRYRIPDRAIPPEVRFEFSGPSGGSAFRWSSSGGAFGEIRMRQLNPDTIEASWNAEELGASLALASGSALLLRRLD